MEDSFENLEVLTQVLVVSFTVLIWMEVTRYFSRSLFLTSVLHMPFVYGHELAHFLISLVFNGKPHSISIWPRKTDEGYVLGEVLSQNVTSYNATPIALAPLLLLGIPFFLTPEWITFFGSSVTSIILLVISNTMIIKASIPSKTDFKIMFMFPIGAFLYLLAPIFFILL